MGDKRDEHRILLGKSERNCPFLSPRPDETIK